MLSKDSEKILKMLKKQKEEYRDQNKESSKVSYTEIKECFPQDSYISITMILKYLLDERYIYNHIEGKEHHIEIDHINSNLVKLVIGEKGIAYLEQKKYRLFAKIIPLTVSIISLLISICNLFFN